MSPHSEDPHFKRLRVESLPDGVSYHVLPLGLSGTVFFFLVIGVLLAVGFWRFLLAGDGKGELLAVVFLGLVMGTAAPLLFWAIALHGATRRVSLTVQGSRLMMHRREWFRDSVATWDRAELASITTGSKDVDGGRLPFAGPLPSVSLMGLWITPRQGTPVFLTGYGLETEWRWLAEALCRGLGFSAPVPPSAPTAPSAIPQDPLVWFLGKGKRVEGE